MWFFIFIYLIGCLITGIYATGTAVENKNSHITILFIVFWPLVLILVGIFSLILPKH